MRLQLTLLILAWPWLCLEARDIQVLPAKTITHSELHPNSSKRLGEFKLTDKQMKDVKHRLKSSYAPDWLCHERQLLHGLEKEDFRAVLCNVTTGPCSNAPCVLGYNLTTRYRCKSRPNDRSNYTEWIFRNQSAASCSFDEEDDADLDERPDEVTVRVYDGKEVVSNLTVRVCRQKQRKHGRYFIIKWKKTKRETVGDGVTVQWRDEVCGRSEVNRAPPKPLQDFPLKVTKCNNETTPTTLQNIAKVLNDVLEECKVESTSKPPVQVKPSGGTTENPIVYYANYLRRNADMFKPPTGSSPMSSIVSAALIIISIIVSLISKSASVT